MLQKLAKGQLIVGDRAPMNIYARSGIVLLTKGSLIDNEQQVQALLAQGYFNPKERVVVRQDETDFQRRRYSKELNPFLELEELYTQLDKAFEHAEKNAAAKGFQRRILGIAEHLLLLAEKSPNALLGAAHWPKDIPSTLDHPMRCAVLLAVVSRPLKVSKEKLLSGLAATLTANLGMLHLQEKLNHQQTPLTEQQKEAIRNHPEKSLLILEMLGVKDNIWLTAVLQHHERLDGSGYPKGLQGSQISNTARLVALADSYAALTAPREYRPLLTPRQAMKQMLGDDAELLDARLGKVFLSQLGLYPPGTPVQLKNGDLAVVTEKGVAIHTPICAGIKASSGQVYVQPPRRDTSETDFAIQKILNKDLLKPLQPFLFWNIKVSNAIAE
ncbi:HD domain-containing protein [Marinospirillum celere]|uniref:HD domain-containing protein n=1 Tax=Marinospirillum celere TaxID=1122252 RepID=A0A1I1J870_9GAMM|nr:HD domain-containing phosphohydrolase [Marinospirillum celere]SFC44646.1 HD domain-containing protein [Marinospirillum celere]